MLLRTALLLLTVPTVGGRRRGEGATLAQQEVSVLPGGAVQIGGGAFVLRSVYTRPGPVVQRLGADVIHSAGAWDVTVDSTHAAAGLWTVFAVDDAFSLRRTLRRTATRIEVNDTITIAAAHSSFQRLPVGTLLGLQIQHVVQFPTGSVAIEAVVPGTLFLNSPCSNAANVDEYGVHRGSFGNPTVFASDGSNGIGLVPLDDVFETHAHTYQRAVRRFSPTQPYHYKGESFADCPVADPPELEIADPMLALRAGGNYTQELAVYPLLGPQLGCEANDYYCFINKLRADVRYAAGAPPTQRLNSTGYMGLNSQQNPINKMGGNEEYQWGLAKYSMPWENWSNDTLRTVLDFQGFGWVTSWAPWTGRKMNCSYNNGIQSCMGTCVSTDLPPSGEQYLRTVAERVSATGRRALMYFHAEISTEAGAATKYADAVITGPSGNQTFYACPKGAHQYYGLFLPNETNSYGQELHRTIEKAFELGFGGLYHDEAGNTASSYTYHLWDNVSALLDPTTKMITATPGSIALLRLKEKLQILDTVVYRHGGVLLMNGHPITRTFRETAIRAGPAVMAEVEAEQENFMLKTHLYSPLGLTREGGASYNFDLDIQYNHTCEACLNETTATTDHCMERSIIDHLDSGVLPFIIGRVFANQSSEPITQRLFPIEIERIGRGFVQGVGKLVTKKSGSWPVGTESVELSIYHLGSLVSRKLQNSAPNRTLQLSLSDGEVAIVEDVVTSVPVKPLRMRELGAYDVDTGETTPVLWYSDLLIVEKIGGSADTIWLPGDVCKPGSTNGSKGVAPCTSRGSFFRVRKQALLGHGSNDPVDTGGGVNIIPGSRYKSFASAYVDDTTDAARPTLWVFGTNDCTGWNKPTGCMFNTSAPGDPWLPCDCPSGSVARGEVWAMWSSDPLLSKSSWRYKKIMSLPPEIGVCNTDVTKGPGGTHLMVLEQVVYMSGGQGYRNLFAQTSLNDLSIGWKLMDPSRFQYSGGGVRPQGGAYDYGDPTIRYFPSDGYYYIVPATPYQKWGHNRVLPGIYPCCFTQWVARSTDLTKDSWVDSPANPLMGFPGPHAGPGNGSAPTEHWGANDSTVSPGSVLDQFGTAFDKLKCTNKTDNINRSDADFVELPASFTALMGLQGPAVYVVWACGDREYTDMPKSAYLFRRFTSQTFSATMQQRANTQGTCTRPITAALGSSMARRMRGCNPTFDWTGVCSCVKI